MFRCVSRPLWIPDTPRGSGGGQRWAGKGRHVKSRSPAFCPSRGSQTGHCFHGYLLSPWPPWYILSTEPEGGILAAWRSTNRCHLRNGVLVDPVPTFDTWENTSRDRFCDCSKVTQPASGGSRTKFCSVAWHHLVLYHFFFRPQDYDAVVTT